MDCNIGITKFLMPNRQTKKYLLHYRRHGVVYFKINLVQSFYNEVKRSNNEVRIKSKNEVHIPFACFILSTRLEK